MSCHGSAFRDQNRHRPPVEGAQPHTQRHLNCGLNKTGISHSSKNQNSCYLWLPHELLWECEQQIWSPEVASMPPAPERAGQKEGWSGPSRKWSTLSERQASCRRSHDPWVPAVFSIQVCGLSSRVHCRLLAWGCFQHCELPLTHPAQREEARWACIKIPEPWASAYLEPTSPGLVCSTAQTHSKSPLPIGHLCPCAEMKGGLSGQQELPRSPRLHPHPLPAVLPYLALRDLPQSHESAPGSADSNSCVSSRAAPGLPPPWPSLILHGK